MQLKLCFKMKMLRDRQTDKTIRLQTWRGGQLESYLELDAQSGNSLTQLHIPRA